MTKKSLGEGAVTVDDDIDVEVIEIVPRCRLRFGGWPIYRISNSYSTPRALHAILVQFVNYLDPRNHSCATPPYHAKRDINPQVCGFHTVSVYKLLQPTTAGQSCGTRRVRRVDNTICVVRPYPLRYGEKDLPFLRQISETRDRTCDVTPLRWRAHR